MREKNGSSRAAIEKNSELNKRAVTGNSEHLKGRRSFLRFMCLSGVATATSASALVGAPAIVRGAGNYKSLKLHNLHTGEKLRTVYQIEGQYIRESIEDLNFILRDWRANEVREIDPKTLNIISNLYRKLDCVEPLQVVSGYRCAQTNALLRKKSRGVANNSYHIKGMAVDISMETRSVAQIYRAAKAVKHGGIGRYSRSSFVHIDSGPVRDWGK